MRREQNGRQKVGEPDVDEIKLLGEIDEREVLEYCKKLVAVPSIFQSEHRISEKIARDLKDFGLEVTSVPVENCGPSIVGLSSDRSPASKPKSSHRNPVSPPLIFNGHMDTVQVCDGWKRDPFSPTVEGERLYGLGSTDMKGGLTAIIMAAKALLSSGLVLKRDFAVHAVSDEEGWSRGTTTLIDNGFYEGAQCCIVGEPSNLTRLRNARRAQCLANIIVTGKATHGAQPENGINAIADAGKVINVLSKLPDKTHPRILDFKLQPLRTSSCILKIEGGSDALSVPDKCVIRLDRHVLPGTTILQELEGIRSYLEHNLDKDTLSRVKVEFTPRLAPAYEAFETDPNSELVKTISNVARDFGYNPPLIAGSSVADDCLIATRCKIPVVSYGPCGDISTHASGGAHEADEFVFAKQVVDAAKIYAVTAYRILNRSEN